MKSHVWHPPATPFAIGLTFRAPYTSELLLHDVINEDSCKEKLYRLPREEEEEDVYLTINRTRCACVRLWIVTND